MSTSRPFTVLTLAIGLALASMVATAAEAADIPKISKEDLKARLGDPNLVILDVRQPRDWKISEFKIKGAVREDPTDVEAWADKYPNAKTYVLYCA